MVGDEVVDGAGAFDAGRVGGRPTVVTPDIIRTARDLLPNPQHSITSIAKLLGVSPGTLHNHIPDLRELRGSATNWYGDHLTPHDFDPGNPPLHRLDLTVSLTAERELDPDNPSLSGGARTLAD